MLCCAFAVILLTALLAPLRALARLLGIESKQRTDTGVAWSPGNTPEPRKPVLARIALTSVAAVALLAGGAASILHLSEHGPQAGTHHGSGVGH